MGMSREDCRIGMKVRFGRRRGEKTVGEIVKLNLKKAKVKILEDRGSRSKAGEEWGVPYSLMEPVDDFVPAKSESQLLQEVLDFCESLVPVMSDEEIDTFQQLQEQQEQVA